jgi:hypothetical protein
MPQFIIDANLPVSISIWCNEQFIHVNSMLLDQFEEFVEHNWKAVIKLSENHKLVKVFSTYIEAVQ